ncbi:HU family DNA-binding protein [Bacteroides heparinolyticus]|uniref:HU family DNA-binding protein n=2 Tax=Prevotella heparinolytica TaxID=28113 RepID=UPI0035A067AF
MTKAEIINEIAEETGISKKDVSAVVESFMESIKKTLLDKEDNVYLRGFGSFIVKHRAEKTARNISKNTTITIPAHKIPSFKPAKTFIEEMKK